MGDFIGCVGAAFIMTAAAAVILKFLMEINVITDAQAVKLYGKNTLITLLISSAYLFISAYIFNCIHGQTNFFDFGRIFSFLDIAKVTEQCQNPAMKGMIGGMMMPLYPCIVKLIGKVVFEKYMLVAVFINVVSVCVSSCLVYGMLLKRFSWEKTVDFMLLLCSIPFVFLIFAPTYVSMTLMFIILGMYALKTNKTELFAVFAVLAVLTSKAGLLALLVFWLYKSGSAAKIIKFIDDKLLSNGFALRITITVLLLINGAALAYLIKGVA